MKIKLTCFIFLLCVSIHAYAQDSSKVEIQKIGGRTETVVLGMEPTREKPTSFLGKGFYAFETGILSTARFSSSVIGKMTDSTVWGVQKTSDILFSPIVKTLDFKRWLDKK